MAVQIYAGNLSYDMTETVLKELFEKFGEVSSVKIISDPSTGKSKGFGFVEMANQDDADKAIKDLNSTEVLGRNIRVNIARPKKSDNNRRSYR